MDVLVVGGASFIGLNFIQHLLSKYSDYNIVCLDNLDSDERKKNIECFDNCSKFYFYQNNQVDILKLFKFWYGFNYVINFTENKLVDVGNLLSIIKKYKVRKYLHISKSMQICNDIVVISSFFSHKIPVTICKYSNCYGPYQNPKEFIPFLITNALIGNKILVHDFFCDWINVIDYCRGLETLMFYGDSGKIYEIGGGNSIKNIDVALFVVNYLKIYESLVKVKFNNIQFEPFTSFSKLNEQYGWKPIITLESGLFDTIDWYKENESWWRPLMFEKENNV